MADKRAHAGRKGEGQKQSPYIDNMNRILLGLLLVLGSPLFSWGQSLCEPGEHTLQVTIVPDAWPQEMSFELTDGAGAVLVEQNVTNSADTLFTFCLDTADWQPCMIFTMNDSYGDGLNAGAYYQLSLNGEVLVTGSGNYGYGQSHPIDCPPGWTCSEAIELTEDDYGTVSADVHVQWWTFTPPNNGMFALSSCGSGCDTRLWIYDYCNMNNFDDTNEGSIYYDDNQGGCEDNEESAQLNVLLEGGVTYWIRFADLGAEGEGCDDFDWTLAYVGLPEGCTDEAACNYNPAAELDNGSCIYPGDPLCTGPDLMVVESAIENSLQAETMMVDENNCYIVEGCLNGYGERELVRFTTHIKNIGDIDYYIGTTAESDSTQQFEWGDCHNHWHYKGYAKYDLFTMDGQMLPIGFKNGFCVMDLECSDGGTFQYGCSNMGISAHCGDIYGAGLSCQWIDVTGIADGVYHLVVRVNWDYSPDALGRQENDYENNWGVVCIQMDRSSGELEVNIWDDCAQLVDCTGEPYGTAQMDCNGDCGGTALMGDLDLDADQDLTDSEAYVDGILGDDLSPSACNDLDQDGELTVSDAALMARCQYWDIAHESPDSAGFHDKCQFPAPHIVNPFDSVWFRLGEVNWEQGFFDVEVLNPHNRILGYQFDVSCGIQQAVSLVDPLEYSIQPSHALGGGTLIGLSYENESMSKHYEWASLCRIYWTEAPTETLCIQGITEVVNGMYQNAVPYLVDPCATANGIGGVLAGASLEVSPNPIRSGESLWLNFSTGALEGAEVQWLDLTGRILSTARWTGGRKMAVSTSGLVPGSYLIQVIQPGENGAVIEHTRRVTVR